MGYLQFHRPCDADIQSLMDSSACLPAGRSLGKNRLSHGTLTGTIRNAADRSGSTQGSTDPSRNNRESEGNENASKKNLGKEKS